MGVGQTCGRCGAGLAESTSNGYCPSCLLREALEGAEPAGESQPTEIAEAKPTRPGQRFGNYGLLEKVGQGGMGIVYKARQVNLNRIVALKLLPFGQFSNEEVVQRFKAEAAAAAGLQHPNIVAIHDVGEEGGQHYFSMDFVEGDTLAEIVREKPLPAKRAATYLKTIAEAVHYAHERGILHRDLKPSNILVDRSDQPRITDFGLAKRLTVDSDMTLTGQVLGSPNFMAPEQAEGRSHEIGPATEVYSLGALLYHLVTRQAPFQGETLTTLLKRVIENEPVPPRLLNPSVPKDLETIVLKCLEKEPTRRYQTAQALAEELERFLQDEPIRARPVGVAGQGWKWCRRQPVRASLLGGLILVFVLGSTGVLWQWHEACLARQVAVENLWRAYLAQGRGNRWSGRPGRRFDSLTALSNAAAIRPSIELRNEAIACLKLPDLQPLRKLPFKLSAAAPSGLAFDPKYEQYALAYVEGSIGIGRISDGLELFRLTPEGKPAWAPMLFSGNGQLLAERYIGAPTNELRVWDLSRRKSILRIPLTARSFTFAAQDRQIVASEETGSIHFYDLASGNEVSTLNVLPALNHISVAPDGKRLAASRRSSPGVVIVDLETQAICRSFAEVSGISFMSWSPDGTLLACPGPDGRVYLLDPNTGERKAALEGHKGLAAAAEFDRAGDLLVSGGWDGMTRLWDPRARQLLLTVPGGWGSPAFGPEDRVMQISVGDETWLWEVEPARECRRLGEAGLGSGWEGSGQFSLDGQLLAIGGNDGVRVWEVTTDRQLVFLPSGGGRSVIFLPDGRSLVTAGPSGIDVWPLPSSGSNAKWQFGAAKRIGSQAVAFACLSIDGRTLLATDLNSGAVLVFDVGQATDPERLERHPRAAPITASSDGNWFATGTWQGTGVKVWEMTSRQPRLELPTAGSATCLFSPDARWLLTGSGAEYCLWQSESWAARWKLPRDRAGDVSGSMAFSPDSQMVALLHGRSTVIKLIAAADGRELATLEAGKPLCFSRDGNLLATASDDEHSLFLWDLRMVRKHLARMNLDWELPHMR